MTSREKFEQEMAMKGWDVQTTALGDYIHERVHLMWVSWQSASKTSEQQLEESQRELRAADATIHNLELKLTDMAVQLANAESKCRELAEFKSRVYAQMGAGCEAPEFSITEGLNNLRRFADTLHAIEREFFTKEVPDEECEGETVEECTLCWGMTVEQYVSEFGKCLAEVRAQGVDEIAELYFTLAAHEANRSIADSWRESARFARDHAAQLRKGAAL